MNFWQKLKLGWEQHKFVCVGLDSDFGRLPQHLKNKSGEKQAEAIFKFNQAIIEATHDLVLAYKPNIAFYEACGIVGLTALSQTIEFLKNNYPDVLLILDAKRADIGHTNQGYVELAFEQLRVDAITVHPYLGKEALEPFLKYKDKGIIILVKTSNPGSGEIQDLLIGEKKQPLYQYLAQQIATEWNQFNNCAVVVGATYPDELAQVRQLVGQMPILIPGIGAQGGDLEKTVLAGIDGHGQGIIVNSSRGIIFASQGEGFAQVARQKTQQLNQEIIRVLAEK